MNDYNNISNYQGRNIKQIKNNNKITFFSLILSIIILILIIIYDLITRTF